MQIPIGGEPADVSSICVSYSYWRPKCATGFDSITNPSIGDIRAAVE
jgi:hypothetical protein